MELIQSIKVASPSSSIVFSNLPQDFKNLQIFAQVKSNTTVSASPAFAIQVNASTANHQAYSKGSNSNGFLSNYQNSSASKWGDLYFAGTAASTRNPLFAGNLQLTISDYTAGLYSKINGTITRAADDNGNGIFRVGGKWEDTAAITTLTFTLDYGSFDVNSLIAIYGF